MVATDWANLTVAGAFVFGAVLGGAATVRLVRALARELREERRRDR